MKYLILHAEGFADIPKPDLDGRTPIQAAMTEHMDRLASTGELGLAVLPSDVPSGADVVALALLGYDPRKAYAGPAPLEAVGLGIAVGEQDVVYRCNMVSLRTANKSPRELKKIVPSTVMEAAALGLDIEEARELIEAINEQLGSETIQFYPGTGDRHFMVWVGGKVRAACANPEEIVGKPVGEYLPSGEGADMLRKLMEASVVILNSHPINDEREEAGALPANAVWFWGQGRSPHVEPVTEERQLSGSVITTSPVHRGVAVYAGLEPVDLTLEAPGPGAFQQLGEAALRELARKDLLYLHVAMPATACHQEDGKGEVQTIEQFDRHVVGTMLNGLTKMGPYRLLLLCDGFPSPERPPVVPFMPYAFYDSTQPQEVRSRPFSAAEAEASQAGARDATKLFARLLPRA